MKALCKLVVLLLACVALASCGGGGGGSNSAFGGPADDTTLSLSATTTTLPICQAGAGSANCDFFGSPFIAEVTATWRHKDGSLVSGTNTVNVSVAPTTIIAYSTLVKPGETPPNDSFHRLMGSGPVDVTAGVGTIFIHSDNVPGTAVLTVTAIDPVSKHTLTAQMTFTIAGAATGLPASISTGAGSGVYVSGSGGPQSTIITAFVSDGSDAPVADPNSFNNVQFQILGPANSDARLAGASGTGTTVNAQTHNGIATVTFEAGSQLGPVQVRATADRADNNVDNGISDGVSATNTIVVSDGKLYGLQLTSPGTNAPSILINRLSTATTLVNQGTSIPPDPNATYSFTVSAHAVDRGGNPVLPGTQIAFGSIDTPVDSSGTGFYQITGSHGDPQEGGNLFTATDGHFTTAGGGAGPGDTLLVIGKQEQGAPAGNDDLESAAKVTSVSNATTLHVAAPFNLNDTTGASVNNGPVLPYIIGRALIGNITSPSFTDANGTASTTLNYPVSKLGHITAVWAQGTSTDTVTGGTKLITDINLLAFPGVAPGKIVVSPNPIPGNTTLPVTACIYDKLGSPVQGVVFQFTFSNLGIGSGTLDGISMSGDVPQATGPDGCVVTTVTTAGIANSSGGSGGSSAGSPSLTFSVIGVDPAVVPIVASNGLVLLANPSALGGSGGTVTLTLRDGNGNPVPGVQIVGTCAGDPSIGIISGPGITNASGQTTATINANLNIPGAPGAGTCTFTTSTGSPSATVTLQGTDPCTSGVSPLPPSCGTGTSTPSTVTLTINSAGGLDNVSLTSSPAGASCSLASGSTTQTCTVSLNGGTYAITATHSVSGTVTWSGSCTPSGVDHASLTVPTATTSGLSCTVNAP